MKGAAIRAFRVLALFPGLAVGMAWAILVALPVFIFCGEETAWREVARGYWLADWCVGGVLFE